jgi:hypothetical protein
MVKVFQSFSGEANRWVKFRLFASGGISKVSDKKIEPTKRYKGVPVK